MSVHLDLTKYYIFISATSGLLIVYGIAVIFNLRPVQMSQKVNYKAMNQ
jgi:hypothetical protein